MKQLIVIFVLSVFCVAGVQAQTESQTDSIGVVPRTQFEVLENLESQIGYIKEYVKSLEKQAQPRYKLYPTTNIYNSILLDTATGILEQVQIGVGDVDANRVYINSDKLVYDGEIVHGRFELYPTQNMYNFVLVDTMNGRTWQAQWNVNSEKRFIVRIW